MAVLTIIGGLIRLWPPGRLGLVHFDEGIYALVGTWSLNPGGIMALDPSLIPYAPPGFPILVGLSYAVLGPSDGAAIAVSQLSGTATIPLVAWLGRRTFGPGAGFASAVLVAFSGPHIAFSRMALTDVSFLLAWVVAIGLGIRFLERPGAGRAIAMGLAVGLAQQFKYNGWLAGGIVIFTALIGVVRRPEDQQSGHLGRVFGWGGLGAVVAALVVLPWFLFVERHGGYSALLEHQRSYLVGRGAWLGSLRTQQAQAVALSGGHALAVAAWAGATIGAWLLRVWPAAGAPVRTSDRLIAMTFVAVGAWLMTLVPDAFWWLSLSLAPWLLAGSRPSTRLMGAWWLATSAITPFYHPYARLWLPVEAAGWVIVGGTLANGLAAAQPYLRRLRGLATEADPSFFLFSLAWAWGIGLGVVCTTEMERLDVAPKPLPGLLSPSDSLRRATQMMASKLPPDLARLRFYGRPSIRYYLGGRFPLQVYPDQKTLLEKADSRTWVFLDYAQVTPRSIPMGSEDWDIAEFVQADLNGPTLLDLEPDSARGVFVFGHGRSAPILLYKPKLPRDAP